MLGRKRLKFADKIGATADCQIGLDPLLEGHKMQLLQAGNRSLREWFIGEVGQRRPAPERERLTQDVRCLPRQTRCERVAATL
jgi:hypothetical protein